MGAPAKCAVLVAVLALAACGAHARPQTQTTAPAFTASSQQTVPAPPPPPVRVAVVVLENKAPDQVLRTGWLARQAAKGGRALNAIGEAHPSLGNYLAMISGSTQGIHDDNVSHGPFHARTIVSQLQVHGVGWRAYMDAMPEPCFGRRSHDDQSGLYAKRHNPFLFFTEVVDYPNFCRQHVVPGRQLAADIASGLPRFVWISPDLCEDMHDCSVGAGQAWMARTLPAVIDALGPRGVLFVAADEGSGGQHIPLVAIGGGVKPGSVMRRRVDHRARLATIEDLLGLGRLPTTRFDATLVPLLRGA